MKETMANEYELEKKLLTDMAARAKARREELGITINDLAVKMGRTYQCIHGMERDGVLSLRVVMDWAQALQCTAEWLAHGNKCVHGRDGMQEVVERRGKMLREAGELIDARRGRRRELVRLIREELGE